MNLGPSRIAVFEDCKATALTTQPPRLDIIQIFFGKKNVEKTFHSAEVNDCKDSIKPFESCLKQSLKLTQMFEFISQSNLFSCCYFVPVKNKILNYKTGKLIVEFEPS